MSNVSQSTLHHKRAEIQGTVQVLFSEGAATLAAANTAGYQDLGNFLGHEIQTEPQREPVLKAHRGVVIEAGSTPGVITLGLDLTTKEVADARKLRYLLSAKDAAALAQAAINNSAVDAIPFSAEVPAVLNQFYPIMKDGVRVREISAITIAVGGSDLEAGVDYLVDQKLGLVRFVKEATLPAGNATPTLTAPAIDAAHAAAMKGLTPMTKSAWRGFAHVLVWDQDEQNNLVMEYEPREVEIVYSSGVTINHESQSELKIQVKFLSNTERVLHRD